MPNKRRRSSPRRQRSDAGLRLAVILVALFVVFVVVACAAIRHQMSGYFNQPSGTPVAIAPQSPAPTSTAGSLLIQSPLPIASGVKIHKVAIIIDDCGYSIRLCEQFFKLPVPLTISILPMTPHGKQIETDARSAGEFVMLHLPMEPESPAEHPGPGEITTAMSDAQVHEQVVADIDFLPDIAGANNHMGSKATSDPRVMRDVLQVFAQHHLFFIDSMTSYYTVGATTARGLGVPTAERDVFLDNVKKLNPIEEQIRILEQLALKRGTAIAIGHPFDVTAQALAQMIPEMQAAGITFVSAQSLVK